MIEPEVAEAIEPEVAEVIEPEVAEVIEPEVAEAIEPDPENASEKVSIIIDDHALKNMASDSKNTKDESDNENPFVIREVTTTSKLSSLFSGPLKRVWIITLLASVIVCIAVLCGVFYSKKSGSVVESTMKSHSQVTLAFVPPLKPVSLSLINDYAAYTDLLYARKARFSVPKICLVVTSPEKDIEAFDQVIEEWAPETEVSISPLSPLIHDGTFQDILHLKEHLLIELTRSNLNLDHLKHMDIHMKSLNPKVVTHFHVSSDIHEKTPLVQYVCGNFVLPRYILVKNQENLNLQFYRDNKLAVVPIHLVIPGTLSGSSIMKMLKDAEKTLFKAGYLVLLVSCCRVNVDLIQDWIEELKKKNVKQVSMGEIQHDLYK